MIPTLLLLYGPSLIGIVVICILIAANDSGDKASKWFVAPMIFLAFWLGLQFWAQSSTDPMTVLMLIRSDAVLACVMALVYYFVMYIYLGRRAPRLLGWLLVAGTVLLGIFSLGRGAVLKAVANANGISLESVTPLYYVLLLYTLLLFVVPLVVLFRATRRLPKKRRTRNYILFYSTLQVVLLSGLGSLLLSGVAAAQVLIVISALIFCMGIFFGIIRHKLFDVRLIAVRTLGYVLSLVTLALVYLVIAYILSKLFFQNNFTSNVSFSPVNIALALILAFIFQPVKAFFDHVTNRIFYRDRYNAEEFFALLSNVLSSTTELRELLRQASDTIEQTFKSRFAFFLLPSVNGHRIVVGSGEHVTLGKEGMAPIEQLAAQNKGSVIVTDLIERHRTAYNTLSRHSISVLLPLWHEQKIIGYLAIGEALGQRYNGRDFKVLDAIADELVIAIQNAMSIEAVREVNANLQDRIDGATRDLRSKNERLKQLDDTKDEFISMASHQLRTPLTSVKGYVSMILDGDAGEINEQQRKFLTEAFDSSNRMAGIIGDFLNVSRLQTGKFTLEREDVDLGELIANEVEHLQNTASVRGLKLHYHKPARFPKMHLDKSKIEQVVMNFIDNAIFYAPNTGAVDIELFQRSGRAVFTVRDHGIGVPKHEQASLFTKFFRATNARSKRPDGTGVGLFLAKKVIVAHKGAIIFESEEGKGSTFGFEIPLVAE